MSSFGLTANEIIKFRALQAEGKEEEFNKAIKDAKIEEIPASYTNIKSYTPHIHEEYKRLTK